MEVSRRCLADFDHHGEMLHLNHGCWLELIIKQLVVDGVVDPPTSIRAFAFLSFDPIDLHTTCENKLV
jgi:hypothetical protein